MAYQGGVRFEWDANQDASNLRKHGVSFTEAQGLFELGVDYMELYDEEHSGDEERLIAIGPVGRGVIMVVWAERADDTIRVISVRPATRGEKALFFAHLETRQ